ncbi:metallophosphoesterase family protein [Caldivirga maquilingensis]|uniref:Phosphoesterase n=1 Tax=Caldivirga maquilingensis (strain ATCC 700844 / DSM 13496 / JCM 10307 / IC-167) TaxID=397948 RepID=A8MDT4_CALMQ|nr:metallophosphoesterase family protein [Caldivirga maquilingensis]ABW01940.1 phosphodiesterase, MJ0936 family [Caldivirga maquilingensis IC-167]
MIRLAVVGDTHIVNGGLPDNCLLRLITNGHFDLIIHTGDLSNEHVLNDLRKLGELIVVAGESDPMPLPDKELLELEGLRLLIIHGHQKEARLHLRRLAHYFNARLVLTGHTHKAMIQDLGELIVVNPGSLMGLNSGDGTMAIITLDSGLIRVRIQGCGWFNESEFGGLIMRADELTKPNNGIESGSSL